MEYIREQVESFTLGLSSKMIENDQFYHLNHTTYTTDREDQNKCRPIHTGNGEPILIPHNANFSDQVLNQSYHGQCK